MEAEKWFLDIHCNNGGRGVVLGYPLTFVPGITKDMKGFGGEASGTASGVAVRWERKRGVPTKKRERKGKTRAFLQSNSRIRRRKCLPAEVGGKGNEKGEVKAMVLPQGGRGREGSGAAAWGREKGIEKNQRGCCAYLEEEREELNHERDGSKSWFLFLVHSLPSKCKKCTIYKAYNI
ncbi:hypothetical protein NE237_025497 [Protea cynaroides]|uniref:Uncharacterized protein n=1 Tax=Protea cynaroides TaxID=273540 RepID=A0A9Q0H1Z8_9MAGN|nr:hypothetical protein NE237_025497 [Protea cynaroides]